MRRRHHIPIEAGDRVRVGPVVVPGATACTACEHARRTAEDPQWPLIAAQLLGRDPVRTDPGLLIEAGVLTGRLLRDALDAPTGAPGRHTSMSVGASPTSGGRGMRIGRTHSACADLLKEADAARPDRSDQLIERVRAARVTPTYASRRSSSISSKPVA
jgi:hypothetical protein